MNERMIELNREGDIAVIEPVVARLDASVAPAFRQEALAAISDGGRRVVVDLKRVEFMDSSGLGALVSILKALGGGAMAVCNAGPSVTSLLKLTRMDKVFAIEPGRAEALARLGR
jgi:anti-sigma B factor antagonist